ncbi:MAG: GtrA family protein [Ferruginibacter sp.]
MKQKLTSVLEFFYPPFQKLMPIQTFRYAACGGMNTVLGLSIYFVGYLVIFAKKDFDFGFFAFKPHIAALFLSFCFSFTVGFLLNKYVVFTGSNLKGRIQLFRYFISYALSLVINYLLLKLFVELFLWNALISQLITTAIIITISFFTQKHFSFREKK